MATCSRVEAQVTSLHKRIRDFLCDLLTSGPSSREKHFRQNFQNFVQGILATHFGDFLASQSSRENCMFCTNRVKSKTIFKKILVSLISRAPLLSCLPLPLPKPPFSSLILHQSSRKGIGFHLFSMYFKFLALVFLDFVFKL